MAERRPLYMQRESCFVPARILELKDVGSHAVAIRLLEEARMAMDAPTYTVMDKKTVPPSGTKHDYMSLSVYNWPNPNTPDGLPYITRDGHINPEIETYDAPAMERMIGAAETLILAYKFSGETAFAEKALQLVRAWFIDPETRMHPNMLYAQYIPGDGGFDRPKRYPAIYVPGIEGKGVYVAFGGVIEGTRFVQLVNALSLLEADPLWPEDEREALKSWFREFMHFLLGHQHGKDEAGTLNNHGAWYCVQVVTYVLFCGERGLAEQFLRERVPDRIALQIQPDGTMPAEMERAEPFHYVHYALAAFCNLAQYGAALNIDLWHYETEDGRSIKRALDWVLPYIEDPTAWSFRVIRSLSSYVPNYVPVLAQAAAAYNDTCYTTPIAAFTEYTQDHRYRLLFPT